MAHGSWGGLPTSTASSKGLTRTLLACAAFFSLKTKTVPVATRAIAPAIIMPKRHLLQTLVPSMSSAGLPR